MLSLYYDDTRAYKHTNTNVYNRSTIRPTKKLFVQVRIQHMIKLTNTKLDQLTFQNKYQKYTKLSYNLVVS